MSREAFSVAYPNIPWDESATELNTRQMAFVRGWQAGQTEMQQLLEVRNKLEFANAFTLATISNSEKSVAKYRQELLEAQAQGEVMRAVIKNTRPYYCTSSLVRDANKALTITPSEALQQYGYEQRALALDYAAATFPHGETSNRLMKMAQEWRNKK